MTMSQRRRESEGESRGGGSQARGAGERRHEIRRQDLRQRNPASFVLLPSLLCSRAPSVRLGPLILSYSDGTMQR